nr:hypothetical protein [Tanacetum cinerariifolium]
HHALTVNPHVYISCIKQFWNTVVVKLSGDVTRVGKGFSGVETPLFETMLAVRDVAEEAEAQILAQDDVQEHVTEGIATEVVPPTPTSPLPSSHVIPSSPPHQSPSPPQLQAAEDDVENVFNQGKISVDLEALWRIVKDRFSTKKPTNFSNEYLLLTLKTMFGELDEHDAIWRNQKSVHGLALVKRWKLLTSCGVHAKVKAVQDAAAVAHAK